MRFKLRTLLVFVTLVAIVMGIYQFRRYQKWLRLIPIENVTEPLSEIAPPTEVRVAFGRTAREKLRTARLNLETLVRKASSRRGSLQGLLLEPIYYVGVGRSQFEKDFGIDPELAEFQLLQQLNDETIELDKRVSYANVLTGLGVKQGLDWMIDHIRSETELTNQRREFRAFVIAPDEWLDGVDVWSLIKPTEFYRLVDSLHEAAARHCPQQLYDFYLQGLRDPAINLKWRIEMARWFHYANPTLEALQASDFLFYPPATRADWEPKAQFIWFLEKYLQTEDPEIGKLAMEYAQRMAVDRSRISKQYFQLICDYADESTRPYLEEHLATPHFRRMAQRKIIELNGNPLQHYRDALDKATSPGAKLTAVSELLYRLKGTGDEQVAKFLHEQFDNESPGRQGRLQYVAWMYFLGDPNATDYYRRLSEEHPGDFAHPKRIDSLLVLFSEYGLGGNVDKTELLKKCVNDGLKQYEIEETAIIKETLLRAGLYHVVYLEQGIEEQLGAFVEMSRGDAQISNIVPYFKAQTVAFEFKRAVHEFHAFSVNRIYDPHLLADALNAILNRNEIPGRFIAHHVDDQIAAYLFYGPPLLAQRLRNEFGIKFMKGADAYFE